MYKRKADKVRPLDEPLPDGSFPGGDPAWRQHTLELQRRVIHGKQLGPYDHLFEPRYCQLPVGFRLTEERWEKMNVDSALQPRELTLLRAMLLNREKALAWGFTEIGRCREDVVPPVVINTAPHQAWQAKSFPVPKSLEGEVVEMLQERIDAGTLERGHGPYRNSWFLVKKKDGKHRLINSATILNSHTIRDAMLPPNPDDFAEDIAGRPMVTLIDFLSGYDQITLHKNSRDLTAIQTPLGLLRQTTLLQGATNSVAQFVRAVMHILFPHLNKKARPYLDDICVKSRRVAEIPDMTKEALPGVRKHVLEHLQWVDGVLADVERSGCTVSGKKSYFCSKEVEVVGYLCSAEGRKPTDSHLKAITEWPACSTVTDVRGFLGVCTYYRLWIPNYSDKAHPLFMLLKKNAGFVWEEEQQGSMEILKQALTTAPALVPLQYGESAGKVILTVDSCGTGFGGCLMQEDTHGKRHPCRYESGLWSQAEQKYDTVKLECRALLHMLRKLRPYLYGIRFTVETDANTLVAQLNRTATDLPGALVTRWIAWIRLWDFDVRHVPGKKNVVADALSRRPSNKLTEDTADLDDYVDEALDVCHLQSVTISAIDAVVNRILHPSYSDQHEAYAQWLVTMRRPPEMSRKEFTTFKQQALKYLVRDQYLFRRESKNVPLRRVVDGNDERLSIIQALHDESGHRGREGTYRRVADRYYWPGLYREIEVYVRTCATCQSRSHGRTEEAMRPTWSAFLGDKWAVDVVHMPASEGKRYLVLAREDISGWVEGRALQNNDSRSVARFIFEDVICRHGLPNRLISDGGPENRDLTAELTNRYGIKHIVVSSYHPQANGMVERGHRPVVDALSKDIISGHGSTWVRSLHAMLWADRTTVKATTGYTPAHLKYGAEHLLPVESAYCTWNTLNWEEVRTTADLLAVRCRQLERHGEDLEEVLLRVRRARETSKEQFDDYHNVRTEEYNVGDLVLLWDERRATDMSSSIKLLPRWVGPYRIVAKTAGFGSYRLSEVDGSELRRSYAGNRLKRFYPRQSKHAPDAPTIPEPVVVIPPPPEDTADIPFIPDTDVDMGDVSSYGDSDSL